MRTAGTGARRSSHPSSISVATCMRLGARRGSRADRHRRRRRAAGRRRSKPTSRSSPERSFHGVFWRGQDGENYESFFVRPHQVGNPDSIQYTPVRNGISSWQLYHGPGFWNPVDFPIDEWFTIRVAFAGERAEVFVAGAQALVVPELKAERSRGASASSSAATRCTSQRSATAAEAGLPAAASTVARTGPPGVVLALVDLRPVSRRRLPELLDELDALAQELDAARRGAARASPTCRACTGSGRQEHRLRENAARIATCRDGCRSSSASATARSSS